jgi:hypothetical protein
MSLPFSFEDDCCRCLHGDIVQIPRAKFRDLPYSFAEYAPEPNPAPWDSAI